MTEEWFRSRAKEMYHEEGEIEIDEDAKVSMSEGEGAYVQAWVWVPSQKRSGKACGSLKFARSRQLRPNGLERRSLSHRAFLFLTAMLPLRARQARRRVRLLRPGSNCWGTQRLPR